MRVKTQSIHFDADVKLLSFIDEKVGKLNQYFEQIIDAEVFLKLDKAANNANKVAEVKLSIPGNDLFAKKQAKSFEEAVDEATEALRRQLQKHKGKIVTA